MKIHEGPAFGALLIGSGLAFLIYKRNQNLAAALVIGAGAALLDYVVLVWAAKFKDQNK